MAFFAYLVSINWWPPKSVTVREFRTPLPFLLLPQTKLDLNDAKGFLRTIECRIVCGLPLGQVILALNACLLAYFRKAEQRFNEVALDILFVNERTRLKSP
jgi:hypothetical protein